MVMFIKNRCYLLFLFNRLRKVVGVFFRIDRLLIDKNLDFYIFKIFNLI